MQKLVRLPKLFLLDESGFIVSSELVLLATILTIGSIAGVVTVRDAVVTELGDLGSAIKGLDQSYSYASVITPCGTAAGSAYIDETNFCTPGYSDDFPPVQLPPIVINPTPGQTGGGEGN
jgi:Flp pilus assembly pilin Flp